MGLSFWDALNPITAIAALVEAVKPDPENVAARQQAHTKRTKERQEQKTARTNTKESSDIAQRLLQEGGATYSGIATGDSAYSSSADTMTGFAAIATPVADAAAGIAGSYFGFKGVSAAATAAAGAASSLGSGLTGALGGSTASNNIRTPLGDVNVTTAAIVATAVVLGLVLTRESGK